MDSTTVPTTAPDEAPRDRVACEPLGYPTPGNVSLADREAVYARDAMTCQLCPDAQPLPRYGSPEHLTTRRYATIDHVIERGAGGCHHPHNLRVLCQSCNPSIANKGKGRRR